MVELNKNLYIGKGAERKCYIHPNDATKVVKIEYIDYIDRDQNKLDVYYNKYLKKLDVSYSNISKCYGYIDTNIGTGVVYDAIKNYDGTISKSFEYIITEKVLSKKEEKTLLLELKPYLSENYIVFGDTMMSNILCQEVSKQNYKLIIVDGLGARRYGFKLWLHMHSRLFTKIRIKKQWKKLLKNYEDTR